MNKYEPDAVEQFISEQTEIARPRYAPKPKGRWCDQMRVVGRGVVACETVIPRSATICPKHKQHYVDPTAQTA